MKKVLIIALGATMLTPFVSEASVSESVSYLAVERTIEVCTFNGHITTRTKGIYDTDANTIRVHGNTYNIQRNSKYGQSGKEGAYEYVAAGKYYFNL